MYAMRNWSVRHARGLKTIYSVIERALLKLHPVLNRIGYQRIEKPFAAIETGIKTVLLDSNSCGHCIVGFTGMSCPMNCPKSMRNGPCGGVRADGKCEVNADMTCVWVLAWEGNQRLQESDYPIQVLQPPLDNRLRGSSAWLREVRLKVQAGHSTLSHTDEF